jgi:hypothetical protein
VENCCIYLGLALYAIGLLWSLGGAIVTHSKLVIIGLVVVTLTAIVSCVVLSICTLEHTSGLCALAGTGLGALAALAVPPRPGPPAEPPAGP